MNKIISQSVLLFLAILSIGLSSCSKDDNLGSSALIGTWSNAKVWYGPNPSQIYTQTYLRFNADGTCEQITFDVVEGKDNLYDENGNLLDCYSTGHYTAEGNSVVISMDELTLAGKFSVKGDALTISLTSDDGQSGTATCKRVADSKMDSYLKLFKP